EVEIGLAGTVPWLDVRVGAREAALEALGQLAVDLVAARAYRWAEQRLSFARPRPLTHHRAHARPRYAGQYSAPSRMQCPDYAAFHVGEQNRHAVGAEDAQHHAGHRGDQPIPFRTRIAIGTRAHREHGLAMNLLELGEAGPARHQPARALPVAIDGARVVGDPVREIKRGIGVSAGATFAA